LTPAERAELGDPLFSLVLKTAPLPTALDAIEQKLMGPSGERRLFVVHEQGLDPGRPGSRRAVLTYRGENATFKLQPNVALSLFFSDTSFGERNIEAWGWDDRNSRYNYYKLDQQQGETAPTWKFRGSSVGADAMSDAARDRTCLRCHINGGPVMKELPLPWNNWHSFKSLLPYLDGVGTDDWPVAGSPRFQSLTGAESLEVDVILPSIRQFNGRRVKALVRALPAGGSQVTDARRLLRPLFLMRLGSSAEAGRMNVQGPGVSDRISRKAGSSSRARRPASLNCRQSKVKGCLLSSFRSRRTRSSASRDAMAQTSV